MAEKRACFGQVEVFALATATIPPYATTNMTAIGSRFFYLIDPGTKESEERQWLKAYVAARIQRGDGCLGILLTHYHLDHTGGVPFLQDEFGLQVYAAKAVAEKADFAVQEVLKGRDKLNLEGNRSLSVIETPGHCPGHLCFYEPEEQVLVAGDMITALGQTLIDPSEGDLKEYLESLRGILRLPLTYLIPGHGEVIESPGPFLQRALLHRLERCLSLFLELSKQPLVPKHPLELVSAVYQSTITPAQMPWAERSVLTSLLWLIKQGMVKEIGVHQFFPHPSWQEGQRLQKYQELVSAVDQLKRELGDL